MSESYVIDARATTAHFPGIGRYVRSLLPALASQLLPQERIIFLCSADQRERLALAEDEKLAWRCAHSSPFGFRQQFEIPRILQRMGVALYHSPYYLMPYRPGVRTVLTVYDVIPMRFPQYASLRARLLFNVTTRLALKTSHSVIAISRSTKEDYMRLFGVTSEQLTTIHLAAAEYFHPASLEEIARVRRKFALRRPYVLYVGSNKPHKNLTRLLAAWKHVVGQLAEPHELVLAGHLTAYDDDLAQQIAARGLQPSVRLIYDVADEDLVALYSGAELFVFPSVYEGFGLPVLEAMACGCAIICGNRSSLPEIVGRAGVLFDPEQVPDIVRALMEILTDTAVRKKMQELAVRRASTFTWERAAAETLRVYRELAKQEL